MWPMILLMARLSDPCLRAGDRKCSATNSRQSADRHYQAIGVDSTLRLATGSSSSSCVSSTTRGA